MKYHIIRFIPFDQPIKDIHSLEPFYLDIGDTLRYRDIDWLVEKKVAEIKTGTLITFVSLTGLKK